MPPEIGLAGVILGVHLAIIAFNILGLFVIPLGGWLGWQVVRIAWLRLLHLAVLAIVAGQAIANRPCFLTIWQNELSGQRAAPQPLIMHWVDSVVYWNIPIWGFAIIYGVVFLYVLALTVLVPFGRRAKP